MSELLIQVEFVTIFGFATFPSLHDPITCVLFWVISQSNWLITPNIYLKIYFRGIKKQQLKLQTVFCSNLNHTWALEMKTLLLASFIECEKTLEDLMHIYICWNLCNWVLLHFIDRAANCKGALHIELENGATHIEFDAIFWSTDITIRTYRHFKSLF